MKINPKIVLLGGGTGSYTILSALKRLTPNISAVVSMSDDGGSTGTLRDELGVLPPGDIRQCLVALSDNLLVRDLFNYRFSQGRFRGQSLGNIILSGLELQYGSFEKSIQTASELLHIIGRVIPVTLTKHKLVMRDGNKIIHGENSIDHYTVKNRNASIELEPFAAINPVARDAIFASDLVVIAPGSLYSSLLPIFAVKGVPEALRSTKAPIVCITNLINKPGQTDGWHVADYVKRLEDSIGQGSIHTVLYNNQEIVDDLLMKYADDGEYPVLNDSAGFIGLSTRVKGARLVSKDIASQNPADTAIRRSLIRHDAEAVCQELQKLY